LCGYKMKWENWGRFLFCPKGKKGTVPNFPKIGEKI